VTTSNAVTPWSSIEHVKRRLLPLAKLLRKIAGRIDPAGHVNYAQEGEDQLLLRLVDGRESGFYVDVGAHDPRRFSNTCVFYNKGWRGINIDPNPQAIRRFDRERPGDINLCCGISDSKEEMKYFEMSDPALNTFDESLARERERLTNYKIVRSSTVKVKRLDVVLQEHMKMPAVIDFMNIDAEGHDLNVLRSNDWNRFRPSIVLTEVIGGWDIEQALSCNVHAYLSLHDYRLIAKTSNTLFYMDRRSV
jgi:FkbM family methyltransferase